MSSLFRSIVILSFVVIAANPATAESAPEVSTPEAQIVFQQERSIEKKPVAQIEATKSEPQTVETRVPLSSRIFAAPTMQQ